MSGERHRRASAVWSRRWLLGAGAPPAVVQVTSDDVRARLDDLPDVFRWGAAVADAVLGVLPEPVVSAAARLPGVSEFARIVETLTAVSYFDAVDTSAPIPQQRRAASAVRSPA